MKAIIEIEEYDNGISLKWKDVDFDISAAESQNIVALGRDKEKAIGKMIWGDIKALMDYHSINTMRMEIEYEPIKEESHD